MPVNRRFPTEILQGRVLFDGMCKREVVHVTRCDDAQSEATLQGASGGVWFRLREEAEQAKKKGAIDAEASHISCPE